MCLHVEGTEDRQRWPRGWNRQSLRDRRDVWGGGSVSRPVLGAGYTDARSCLSSTNRSRTGFAVLCVNDTLILKRNKKISRNSLC